MAENPLPTVPAGTVSPESMAGSEATVQAKAVLDSLNAAIAAKDPGAVAACFYSSQAWWKDSLALTYQLRTFKTPDVVAQALLETVDLRGCGKFSVQGEAVFIPATPFLVSHSAYCPRISSRLTFRALTPLDRYIAIRRLWHHIPNLIPRSYLHRQGCSAAIQNFR